MALSVVLSTEQYILLSIILYSFSSTLLVGWQEEHPACNKSRSLFVFDNRITSSEKHFANFNPGTVMHLGEGKELCPRRPHSLYL